jgi:starch phosphorylase
LQIDVPDYWLSKGNPWEIPRNDICHTISFGGKVVGEGIAKKWVADW